MRHRRPAQFVTLGEAVAKHLRQRGHLRKIGGAATIDPVPQLTRTKRFSAELGHLGHKGVASKADEVAARIAGRGISRHHSQIWQRLGRIAKSDR